MTTKIPNNEKILIVLKKYDSSIISSDLAEYCRINPKNIGRYLDKLTEKKLISRKTIQEGKKRYITNKILAKGKNKKVNFTYDEVMKEIELTDMKEAIDTNNLVGNETEIREVIKQTQQIEVIDNHINNIIDTDAVKTELLGMIKVIAIRNVDAIKLGLKDKQELIDKLISLILIL